MVIHSIKRLRYFKDLAETGNFSASARRLGIAQPALSIAIRKLEEETGLKLINRADRQTALTADGRVVLEHANRILTDINNASRQITDLQDLDQGEIHIGASAMLASYYLPEFLLQFHQKFPGIRVQLVEAGTETLEQQVIDGELDLALLRAEPRHEQIRYAARLDEQVVVCLPKDHALAAQHSIRLEQFCAEPLVMFRKGYFLRDSVAGLAAISGLKLDVRMETNLIELLKRLVSNRVGIATSLSMILSDDSDLCTRPFDPVIPLELAWGWKKNHYLSRAAQAFLSYYQQRTY